MSLRYGSLGEAGGALFWSDDLDSVELYDAITAHDAAHVHGAETKALSQGWTLSVSDATHGHSGEMIGYLPHNPRLTVQDAASALSSDGLTVGNYTYLQPSDATSRLRTLPFRPSLGGTMVLSGGYHDHSSSNLLALYGQTTEYRFLIDWTDPTPWGPDDHPLYELRYRIDEDDSYVHVIGELPSPFADFTVNLRSDQTLEVSVRTVNDGMSTLWTNWQIIVLGSASILEPSDTRHPHIVGGSFAIWQANRISVSDAMHVHSADAFALTQSNRLEMSDAPHAHSTDAISLFQANLLSSSDGLHAHSSDATNLGLIAQISMAEALHALSSDSPSFVQANRLVLLDSLHAHYGESITINSSGILSAYRCRHFTHTADNVSLTQANRIGPFDALHAHASENANPSSLSVLGIGESRHIHLSDLLFLTQANRLETGEASHAHLVDALGLSTTGILSPTRSDHAHLSDSTVLLQANQISLTDSVHSHEVDALGLIQQSALGLEDGSHAHLSDSVILLVANALPVNHSDHGHLVDAIGLLQANRLSLADGLHAHLVEVPTPLLPGFLSVSDGAHALYGELIAVMPQSNALLVAESLHAHGVLRLTLTQSHLLAPDGTLHGHVSDALGFVGVGLIVGYATHGHLADSFDLGDSYSLIVRDALNDQSSDAIELSPYYYLYADGSLHFLYGDQIALGGQIVFAPNSDRIFLVRASDRVFVVHPGDRLFVV